MESIEDILSKQCAEFKFRNEQVEYFSFSTQHSTAKTLDEAINNILEADKKYEGKTPLGYAMEKRINDQEYRDPIAEIYQNLKDSGFFDWLFE